MKLWLDRINSAIGTVFIVSDGKSLCAIDFSDYEHRMRKLLSQRYAEYELVEQSNPQGFSDRLRAYFDRDFSALNDLPVNPGGTEFQQQVWQALRSIPDSFSCGGDGEFTQSDRYCVALSSGGGCEWQADGLCGGAGKETVVAGT
jgi:6-O-methylguanine DNA methyltransferase, ribonuclease-like domain